MPGFSILRRSSEKLLSRQNRETAVSVSLVHVLRIRPGKTGKPFDCIHKRLPHFQHPWSTARESARLFRLMRRVSMKIGVLKSIIGWGRERNFGRYRTAPKAAAWWREADPLFQRCANPILLFLARRPKACACTVKEESQCRKDTASRPSPGRKGRLEGPRFGC